MLLSALCKDSNYLFFLIVYKRDWTSCKPDVILLGYIIDKIAHTYKLKREKRKEKTCKWPAFKHGFAQVPKGKEPSPIKIWLQHTFNSAC